MSRDDKTLDEVIRHYGDVNLEKSLDRLNGVENKLRGVLADIKEMREHIERGETIRTTMTRRAPTAAETLNFASLTLTSLVSDHNNVVTFVEESSQRRQKGEWVRAADIELGATIAIPKGHTVLDLPCREIVLPQEFVGVLVDAYDGPEGDRVFRTHKMAVVADPDEKFEVLDHGDYSTAWGAIFETAKEYEVVSQWVATEAETLHEKTDDEEKIDVARRLAEKMTQAPVAADFSKSEVEFISEVVDWRLGVSDEIRHDDPEYENEYLVMRAVAERLDLV